MEKVLLSSKTKSLLYYADLICQKIDLHIEAFAKRIVALRRGKLDHVEYIEKMELEPLNMQIHYLVKKALEL